MGAWVKKIAKIYKTMGLLEKKKSTEPCLSHALGGLVQCLRAGVYGPLMKLPLSLATVLEYSQTLPTQGDNVASGRSYGLAGETSSPRDAHSITVGSNHLQDPVELPMVIHQKSSDPGTVVGTREDSVDSALLEREANDLFQPDPQDPLQPQYHDFNPEPAGDASQSSQPGKQEQQRSGTVSPSQLNQDLRSVTPATDASAETWQQSGFVPMTAGELQKARGHRLTISSHGGSAPRDNLS